MILSTLLLLSPAVLPQGEADKDSWTIAVDRLHVGDGRTIDDALVTITDGRISAVVAGGSGAGAMRVDGAHMTPGLVDAFSYMGIDPNTVEESRESTPSLRVADSVRLDAPAFGAALREGVTGAFLTPDSLNVIGGLGAMVKTAGGRPADLFADAGSAAQVIDPAGALKLSLGGDASRGNWTPSGRFTTNYRARRPNTRMGTVWVIRREFYRAMDYAAAREGGLPVYDADLEVLAQAMRGEVTVRFQARRAHDVETALRLAEEFSLPSIVIEEGTESHDVTASLTAKGVPVVTGPAYDSRARNIARGPQAIELRYLASPPAVCCEDLHDVVLAELEGEHGDHDEHGHAAHSHHDEETGLMPVSEFVLEQLVAVAPRYGASGYFSGRRMEGQSATPAGPALLAADGVPVSLGGAEAHDASLTEASLIHQARNAVRWGMDPAEALVAVTSRPAALCGVGDRLGQVAAGYDADLVVWSGDPLASSSRPVLVFVDGRLVVDNRTQD
jgi:imidazolonepropionase-like amidohydrolase